MFSFRIGTALKHIISEEVTARRQLDISHGVNTLIGENKAVVVGTGHAAAHLTAGVGTVFWPVCRLKVAGHDCIIVVVILINILFGNRMFAPFCVEKPRAVSVSSPQRQHLVRRNGAAPAGAGIERGDNAAFFCQITQCIHISFAVIPAEDPFIGNSGRNLPCCRGMHIFIVNLRGDDRTAVFVEKSLHLPCNLFIQPFYIVQKSIVQLTDFK